MNDVHYYLALDIGAESGRGMLGRITDTGLAMEEVHRFPNGPITADDGSLRWDFPAILTNVRTAIREAASRAPRLDGIAVDTWGVDYGLLGEGGNLLEPPYHYRDSRTAGMMDVVFTTVPKEEVYRRTGIQFLELNTLYQLAAAARARSRALAEAHSLLLMPDLITYHLCGSRSAEFTIATTTQCYDPIARDWARDILERLGIPTRILPPIVPPATRVGTLAGDPPAAIGTPVIAAAGHDTACAVAALPTEHEDIAYLSCGTWSLLGVETQKPILTDEAMRANFTNEGGVDGFRFLKNIAGLWVIQECRRAWLAETPELDWPTVTAEAEAAPRFATLVDPDDPAFLRPGDMPSRIAAWCAEHGLPVPTSRGQTARACLEGLALRYRITLQQLEQVTGRTVRTLHIVGGGSRNALLCQFAADATGREVIAGPAEGTAAGNILVQAMATGKLSSLEEARALLRRSVSPTRYEPRHPEEWDQPFEHFLRLVETQSARAGG